MEKTKIHYIEIDANDTKLYKLLVERVKKFVPKDGKWYKFIISFCVKDTEVKITNPKPHLKGNN